MADGKKRMVLAAVCDFGWGSLGKLRLILDHLSGLDVTLFGNAGITKTTKSLLGSQRTFCDRPDEDADVAVVINDPMAANRIAVLGVPVIYVDSLPYLWMTADEVPDLGKVAYYCAQKYPQDRLPVSNPLRARNDIIWIDPIVPRIKRRRGGQGVVVSVGGLHSHLVGDAADAYLSLVIFPLIEILRNSYCKISAICGNLPATARQRLAAVLPDCGAIGPQTPYDFEQILKDADLLVASPGSTTILQAISIGLPTLLLPPQNLSQIFNARIYTKNEAEVMQWPTSVLEMEQVERLRPQGEDAVLAYIYASIANAGASPSVAADVADVLRRGITNAPQDGVLNQSILELGSAGAIQVARLIKQAIFAPLPRGARATGAALN